MLDKIKFINNDTIFNCSLYIISDHAVRLIFSDKIPDIEILENGFLVYNYYNNEIQGDFSEYKTVYRTYESDASTVELSNNETVYVPFEEPIGGTEIKLDISQIKEAKVKELQSICKTNIEKGVDVDIDGTIEHFNYSILDGDQEDIDSLFTAAATTKMGQSYHCHNGNCKIYTVEQIVNIYVAQKINTMHHKTYFNQFRQYILNTFTDDSEINTVLSIAYGDELNGEYLDTYNFNMDHAKAVIETTLSSYGLLE